MIDLSPNDYPTTTSEYGKPPEGTEKQCEELCKGRSIKEINQLRDYFSCVADAMNKVAREDMTMEDFEKAKKSSTQSIPTMSDTNDEGEE